MLKLCSIDKNYTIQAKAIDRHDNESGWLTLEVNIPKKKSIKSFLLFLEKLIDLFYNIGTNNTLIYDKLAGF